MGKIRVRKFPKVNDLANVLGLIKLLDVNKEREIKTQSVYRVG